jgi:hypothetical protein
VGDTVRGRAFHLEKTPPVSPLRASNRYSKPADGCSASTNSHADTACSPEIWARNSPGRRQLLLELELVCLVRLRSRCFRADGKQLCCRPGTAVKLIWPAVQCESGFGWRQSGDLGP